MFLGAVRGDGDPLFTDDDRDIVFAVLAERAETCPHCGTRESEWDPSQGGDRHAYVAEVYRCPGCETKAWTQRSWAEGSGESYGAYTRLIPKDQVKPRTPPPI